MKPSSAREQSDGEPPSRRRGRKPAPIDASVGAAHRALLEHVRDCFTESRLRQEELVRRSGYSKARISEFLRGKGYYPSWMMTYSVVAALRMDIPLPPVCRLWTAGAREAGKKNAWIHECIQEVHLPHPGTPPVAYTAFTETMREPYTAFVDAVVQHDARARWIIRETFDILWLRWHEAAASEHLPRYAWCLLRARLMERARFRDGHVDLRAAAFTTVAQSRIEDLAERFAHISTHAAFFDTVARLPERQFDVVVLRYLCGVAPDDIPGVVGLPETLVHTLDHHARGALEAIHLATTRSQQ
ncbi:XRE family transcriptional regulator [Streptomyces fuscigenes]|uniref:XRE family transcriptional regulator n=1 Tax=Streptomyces fuscigenes TaxID=1528880 RepID=UPI001F45C668|nr:XRE family transcriptional regulator [Streptomyces fuscigenes]MCF3962406.1 XRE family transcriptional regulator [Streptomyces fuscigenes]